MPKVTVFMPVYNCEQYLREAIFSILNQKYKDFELLIIDDGSSDNSLEIIKSIEDKRLKLIKNEKNMGLPYTRNLGLKLAEGEYIALMDADDISTDERLKKQVEFLDNNKNIDIVSSNCDFLIDNKLIKGKTEATNSEDIKIKLMFGNIIPNPTVMFRKEFIYKNNIQYREECFVAQDYGFWIDCCKKGELSNISESLVKYRKGHNNITKKTTEKKAILRKKIIDEIRIRALNNNGFYLKFNEYEIFNCIFSDPVINLNREQAISGKVVLDKIIEENIKLRSFECTKLSNEIKYAFTSKILISKLSFGEKFIILNKKFKFETVKSLVIANIRLIKYLFLQSIKC